MAYSVNLRQKRIHRHTLLPPHSKPTNQHPRFFSFVIRSPDAYRPLSGQHCVSSFPALLGFLMQRPTHIGIIDLPTRQNLHSNEQTYKTRAWLPQPHHLHPVAILSIRTPGVESLLSRNTTHAHLSHMYHRGKQYYGTINNAIPSFSSLATTVRILNNEQALPSRMNLTFMENILATPHFRHM